METTQSNLNKIQTSNLKPTENDEKPVETWSQWLGRRVTKWSTEGKQFMYNHRGLIGCAMVIGAVFALVYVDYNRPRNYRFNFDDKLFNLSFTKGGVKKFFTSYNSCRQDQTCLNEFNRHENRKMQHEILQDWFAGLDDNIMSKKLTQ